MKRHTRRPLAFLGWVAAVAMCLGLLPQRAAALRAMVTLADTNQSWSYGQFFRTGYASADIGGVQLVPRKVTTAWNTSGSKLPRKLSSQTSLTYHDRIFVVGGNTLFGTTDELIKSNAVFAARLRDDQTGALEAWVTLPPLPLALSEVSGVVVELGGQPFLVVLGGMTGRTDLSNTIDLNDVTTGRVFFYPIREDALGNLVTTGSWSELADSLPQIPAYEYPGADGRGGGASGMSAVAVTVGTTPYIYIFGGHYRTNNNVQYNDKYLSDVYRSPVTQDASGNPVVHDWQSAGNISQVGSDGVPHSVSLAGAAAVTFPNPVDNSTGFYLIGGLNNSTTPDANAYIAKIAQDGVLTWRPTGNMSEARSAHAAIQSKGQITVVAGTANLTAPETSLARGYIMDDLLLFRPDALSPNFEHIDNALSQPRMYHSMASLSGAQFGDWAYILGGKVPDPATGGLQQATDHVLVGDLDAPVVQGDQFVTSGNYYSKIFDFGTNAQYFNLSWRTIIAAGQQIQLRYRAGDDRTTLGSSPFQTIPVTSQDGTNSYQFPLPSLTARYFQFVATLGASNSLTTPTLDAVQLDVNRSGYPNLRVVPGGTHFVPDPIAPNSTIVPSVLLANKSSAGEPILEADWDGPGSFFVDIYVTPPGQTPRAPVLGQTGVAYAEVNKHVMGIDDQYSIPPASWRPSACPLAPCPQFNWKSVFNTAGTYTVYMMVDSTDNATTRPFGEVVETDTRVPGTLGESNNVFGPFTLTVQQNQLKIYLPVIRTNAPAGTAQNGPSAPEVHDNTLAGP